MRQSGLLQNLFVVRIRNETEEILLKGLHIRTHGLPIGLISEFVMILCVAETDLKTGWSTGRMDRLSNFLFVKTILVYKSI